MPVSKAQLNGCSSNSAFPCGKLLTCWCWFILWIEFAWTQFRSSYWFWKNGEDYCGPSKFWYENPDKLFCIILTFSAIIAVTGWGAPKAFPIAAINPFLIFVPMSLECLKSSSTNGTISPIPLPKYSVGWLYLLYSMFCRVRLDGLPIMFVLSIALLNLLMRVKSS